MGGSRTAAPLPQPLLRPNALLRACRAGGAELALSRRALGRCWPRALTRVGPPCFPCGSPTCSLHA